MSGKSFGRDKRMLDQASFQRVFDEACYRISHKNYLILVRPNSGSGARLGLVIGKKKVPTAVARNRIKRLVRESFRRHWTQLPPVDVIFLARSGLNISASQLYTQLPQAWIKLQEELKNTGRTES